MKYGPSPAYSSYSSCQTKETNNLKTLQDYSWLNESSSIHKKIQIYRGLKSFSKQVLHFLWGILKSDRNKETDEI